MLTKARGIQCLFIAISRNILPQILRRLIFVIKLQTFLSFYKKFIKSHIPYLILTAAKANQF